jgi:hypothetical protein
MSSSRTSSTALPAISATLDGEGDESRDGSGTGSGQHEAADQTRGMHHVAWQSRQLPGSAAGETVVLGACFAHRSSVTKTRGHHANVARQPVGIGL